MNSRRDIATNEHTQNIRAGIITLKTKYGLAIDEYDYLDLAVDVLRDIRHYGITEYYAAYEVDSEGTIPFPCNVYMIDAVTSLKQGMKQFKTRIEYKIPDENTDAYYSVRSIADSFGWELQTSGLTKYSENVGYVSYHISDDKRILVGKEYAGETLVVAFTGISVDTDGYPMITRKQANALAAYAGKYIVIKNLSSGNKRQEQLLDFFIAESGRLVQAASIPENITDNELDTLMDVKTSFNRKSYNRPTKYSR